MTDFDKLWNYNNPAETEIKFREVLKETSPEKNLSEYLQLLTQIARTQGLQRKFEIAHQTLDEVAALLIEEHRTEHIRYFLERGRAFNSSGVKRNAEVCFRTALDIAQKLNEDAYAIDAIHMLAIISSPDVSVLLNEEAILFAEKSEQPEAKKWLGSLYNNLAWGYFDKKEFEKRQLEKQHDK